MNEEKSDKPKLTYEEVQQIIDDQLSSIETAEKIKKIQETECLSASSVKRSLPEKKQRNRFRSYLRKLFKRRS
ncbi:hypothetical protein [Sanguibacteroides justesenii]|uniref:Uncharacterized protein n=1 Tax=Sanguibacteroides justesenii TaxID=1547597 RepID=A0A0C3NI92_9PORP|nr:hypothetical protein [Sanguibacteroides justesenii]KIO45837.1 hypothetical protein BA92_05125 [Sanguibacteroides justesenii]